VANTFGKNARNPKLLYQ